MSGTYYMNKGWKPGSDRKSFGRSAAETAIFVMIVAAVFIAFAMFLEFLTEPFRKAKTFGDYLNKVREDFIRKAKKRQEFLDAVESHENDPMNRYQEEFLRNPGQGDSEILEWFTAWQKGEIPDSQLRWAPSIYGEDIDAEDILDQDVTITAEFLDYLERQLQINAGAVLGTIKAQYPEFEPTLEGIRKDIAAYRTEIRNISEDAQLRREINKIGLDGEYAEYLLTRPAEVLREEALFLKKAKEFDIPLDLALVLMKHKHEPSSELTGLVKMYNLGIQAQVFDACYSELLTGEEMEPLFREILELKEEYGREWYLNRDGEEETLGTETTNQILKEHLVRIRNARNLAAV